MKTRRIGFIGLGIMGKPMSRNLLKAGFDLTVYNRSKSAVDELVAEGADSALSPKTLAERCDIVVTMLTDSAAVEEVVLGREGISEGAHEGLVLVDMSTISPSVTRKISGLLSSKGVRMLDAPVSGGDVGARDATLTIMVGGEPGAFEECLPVLQAMGKKVVNMGGSGAGQLTKLANQILVACNMVGVCECLNFARCADLDLAKVIDSLSGGAASSWSLVNLGPKVARRDYAPGFKVGLLQKDLRYVISSADEVHAALPATKLVHELYSQVEGAGMGDSGTQALLAAIERLSNQE